MIASITAGPRVVGNDLAALNRRITGAGLSERRPGHHTVGMSVPQRPGAPRCGWENGLPAVSAGDRR